MRPGNGSVYKRGSVWWITYNVDGKQHRETSGSSRKSDAHSLLAQRVGEISDGRFVGPANDRMSWDDLEAMITDHYATKRSRHRAAGAIKHLREHFCHRRVKALTLDVLTRYRNKRFEEGASPATVKYELAIARKGLNLAARSGKLVRVPPLPEITVENTRAGFFEKDELQSVLLELPTQLRGLVEVAYITGWRVRSELQPMTWSQVDLAAGTIRLEPGTTKNGRGRTFPIGALPALQSVFEHQRAYTDEIQRLYGKLVPYVFHRAGRPIKDLYSAWRGSCKRAGLLGRVLHDFRRTAVRNLERAGVSRSVAMQLVGHETEAMYRRYAITTERDLVEGVTKLQSLESESTATKIKPMQPRRTG